MKTETLPILELLSFYLAMTCLATILETYSIKEPNTPNAFTKTHIDNHVLIISF